MAFLHGYELVMEVKESLLKKALQAAWLSEDCPSGSGGKEGRIPEFLDLDNQNFGDYALVDGQIQIPQNELDAWFLPAINGAELKFGLNMQIHLAAKACQDTNGNGHFIDIVLNMTSDLQVKVPIKKASGSNNVNLILDDITLSDVSANLTSPNPVAQQLDFLIDEYVHKNYDCEVIPNGAFRTENLTFFGQTDIQIQIFDDDLDPDRMILTSRPTPGSLEISLPVYVRFSPNTLNPTPFNPFAVETRLVITAPFYEDPVGSGNYKIEFSNPSTITTTGVVGSNLYNQAEADNFDTYNAINFPPFISPGDAAALIESTLIAEGNTMVQQIGDQTFETLTVAEIEAEIEKQFYYTFVNDNKYLAIWSPEDQGVTISVWAIHTKVHNDYLAIGINPSAGNAIAGVINFIPSNRDFAIGVEPETLIKDALEDGGIAPANLPKPIITEPKKAILKELTISPWIGVLKFEGKLNIQKAILNLFPVNVKFSVNTNLYWDPNGALNGNQRQEMKSQIVGTPDIKPEKTILFWILALVLVLTLGIVGLILAILIPKIVKKIAEKIASQFSGTEISTGWSPTFENIGNSRTLFYNPIVILPFGIFVAGTLEVLSYCAGKTVLGADSGGNYNGNAGSPVNLIANTTHTNGQYRWRAGDGTAEAQIQDKLHTYSHSGLYVAKHAFRISEPGSVGSRHFAQIKIKNLKPVVDAGPDITINEGEEITLVGTFEDIEYLDTHQSWWNFGDASPLESGVIAETNVPPKALGTTTVKHAWCQSGEYQVSLLVLDNNGGFQVDTLTVTVLNVPPVVKTPERMFAYPCTTIRLEGHFTDPGWCDKHYGTWDFGDCSPVQKGVIRETNLPPAAVGTNCAYHVYEHCGVYCATCTVYDEDGGIGKDNTCVEVVNLKNPCFDGGFWKHENGLVGNYWQPFYAAENQFAQNPLLAFQEYGFTGNTRQKASIEELVIQNIFYCESCLFHCRDHAQAIVSIPDRRIGIYQQLGANPGWCYQVSAWFLASEAFNVIYLGIDPKGDTDPAASSVIWVHLTAPSGWQQLSEKITAESEAITIYLAVENRADKPAPVYVDDVSFQVIQPHCPDRMPLPKPKEDPGKS